MISGLFCFVLYKIVKWRVTEETQSMVSGKTGERVNILTTEECGRTLRPLQSASADAACEPCARLIHSSVVTED